MLGRKGTGRGRGSDDYHGIRPLDMYELDRPVRRPRETWRSRLAVVSSKRLTASDKNVLRARFTADAVLDAGHVDAWRWLASHAVGRDWLVVVDADARPVDGFRRKLDSHLARASSAAVALYAADQFDGIATSNAADRTADQLQPWTIAPADVPPLGLAVLADVAGDLALVLERQRPVWDSAMTWAANTQRTVQYAQPHLLTLPRKRSTAARDAAPRRRRARSVRHRGERAGRIVAVK